MRRTIAIAVVVLIGLSLMGAADGKAGKPNDGGPPKPAKSPVAAFNMAAVMRDYEKAKYEVYLLNKLKVERSSKLLKVQEEYIKLQTRIPVMPEGDTKVAANKELADLKTKYETEQQAVNKILNDEASKVISRLYDEIQGTVDGIATESSFYMVLAYPDAVTPDERDNPKLKEMKLKPPAAQPFFLAKSADITAALIHRLNTTYPPLDENGNKVNVSKLPVIELPGTKKKD
jgi:Skp family chaperone for outer membrane proteins